MVITKYLQFFYKKTYYIFVSINDIFLDYQTLGFEPEFRHATT